VTSRRSAESVAVPSPWWCRRDIERRVRGEAPSVRVRVEKKREEREENSAEC
jgi:hypothetical protein